MNMYPIILYAHSWIRWAIILLAVVNIFNSIKGVYSNRPYSIFDNRLSLFFVSAVHLQATLGLLLYFIFSPFAFNAILSGAPVMTEDILRFWSIEHIFAMTIAVTLITIGRVKTKKASKNNLKFKIQLIYFGMGVFFILSALPYLESGRWFRF